MSQSPYKNLGFVIVRQPGGELKWLPANQPLDGGVTLLYAERDRRGCLLNDGNDDQRPALMQSAQDAIYGPVLESIRQELVKVWGSHPEVHEIVGYYDFLEVVVKGLSCPQGLPSTFMGLAVRYSPLHQPNMCG